MGTNRNTRGSELFFFFPMRVVEYCNGLLRELMESPSLEIITMSGL